MQIYNDDPAISTPNKIVKGMPYWFFRYFPDAEVDIIDNQSLPILRNITRALGFEILQGVRAFIGQRRYDLILSHSYNSAFLLSTLRSLFSQKKPPHYVIDVGSLNGGVENPLQISLIKFSLRSVAGLIFHSMINEAFYNRHFSETRREFIHFGNNPESYRPSHAESTGEYALSIGYAFRDYDTLVKAWSQIGFPLKIAGIEKLNLERTRNVELLGMLPQSELVEYIRGARFVVLPIANVRYSIGQMTLTQCMAMGKAVIASRSYGVLDYCKDGENCLMYECGNAQDLAERVRFLLNNPNTGKAIATRARDDVVALFNEKRMAQKMLEFISGNTKDRN